ncbi:iron-sulfur cluster biosynthesis family protein [Pseudodesulfovibrio sediminis]|uniref:Core domain-containing protein n=1 Tax=Pseudodesulfovibrio sediminis TaxID=2810563 RepID=A0ABN6EVP9_9BACT|nr:iron-sulfur cluster biosynthesis family protein [Pseudodesulfovibrio sediminis]BCS89647.1 hypothetical protein PSDVSF_28890 [Pseudodesulfovibrio sediminis]
MITATESATKQLLMHFAGKEAQPIRIYPDECDCKGKQLTLTVDTPTDKDEVFETDGFTFFIDKDLQAEIGNVTIDMTYNGFVVTSDRPIGGVKDTSSDFAIEPCGSGSCSCGH